MNKIQIAVLLVFAGLLTVVLTEARQQRRDGAKAASEPAAQKLALPKDFRQWVFLSSGLGMSYDPNATAAANPPFENVFVNPEAYRAFLEMGTWPDKTVLVLEIRASESQLSINRSGRVQTNLNAIEVHTKDLAHGGWAFYAFTKGAQEGALLPSGADCYTCHEKNGAVDSTFVQFYPTLIDTAKNKGTYKAAQ